MSSPSTRPARAAFTLIEVLVVIAVVAVLVSLLLPALSAAKEAGRSAVCLSNLRQAVFACREYADEYRGRGPAIGQPYTEVPNWALVVQVYAGREGSTPGELYSRSTVLLCPTIDAWYRQDMTRTYAMNGTGHAGLALIGSPADPDNYDSAILPPPSARPAAIELDRIERPSDTPLLMDSAVAIEISDAPPPTRTTSVLDFRQPVHVAERLGRFHGGGAPTPPDFGLGTAGFNVGFADGSARTRNKVDDWWRQPLP